MIGPDGFRRRAEAGVNQCRRLLRRKRLFSLRELARIRDIGNAMYELAHVARYETTSPTQEQAADLHDKERRLRRYLDKAEGASPS